MRLKIRLEIICFAQLTNLALHWPEQPSGVLWSNSYVSPGA